MLKLTDVDYSFNQKELITTYGYSFDDFAKRLNLYLYAKFRQFRAFCYSKNKQKKKLKIGREKHC